MLLLGTDLALAAALVASSLRPRPLRLVPSARAESELLPGAVPEATLREFALRYVLHLDNFTPSTIEEATATLRRMVSPRTWSGAAEALERRKQVVLEGRMGSQVIPLSTRVEGGRVTVEALRRTFVADKLSREARVRYAVALEPQPPTDSNPFGLGVITQEIEELPAPEGEKP